MNLRCFIAIGIPAQIKQEIRDLLDILKKYDVDVKWLFPENIHLTLKFLGSTSDILLPRINESILTIVSSYEPFYINIYSTGIFPNKKYPRVIWAGVNSSEILMRLQNDIEHSMSLLGYKREGKEFKPHLTLGRVRSRKGIINVINELENFRDKDFGTFAVHAIKLMKSELNPKGAEYICLYDIPLGIK
jgi:2'-5' RNA ligase